MRHLKNSSIIKTAHQVMLQPYTTPFPSEAFDQQIDAVAKFTPGKMTPATAHILLTNRCPYNCRRCSNAYHTGPEMPLEVIGNLIAKLQERGLAVIAFTGGEPLLRGDLAEIISSVGPKSMCILFTTG